MSSNSRVITLVPHYCRFYFSLTTPFPFYVKAREYTLYAAKFFPLYVPILSNCDVSSRAKFPFGFSENTYSSCLQASPCSTYVSVPLRNEEKNGIHFNLLPLPLFNLKIGCIKYLLTDLESKTNTKRSIPRSSVSGDQGRRAEDRSIQSPGRESAFLSYSCEKREN